MTTPPILVEACVTSVAEAVGAAAAGAQRLELCRALELEGLTPPPALVREVVEAAGLPVFALARPAPGPFTAPGPTARHLVRDAAALIEVGAHGIVAGVLDEDGEVCMDVMVDVMQVARGRPVTFHRAFDQVRDPLGALGQLAELGVARVLTSGGAESAWEGRERLRELVQGSGDRVTILAGGRVRGDHVAALVEATGVREVHARGAAIPGVVRALRV